jgi:hypothetical protein
MLVITLDANSPWHSCYERLGGGYHQTVFKPVTPLRGSIAKGSSG